MVPIKEADLILEKCVQEMVADNEAAVAEIIKTISQAEMTGSKIYNTESEQYIASCRLGSITQWVWYSHKENRYIVHKAYNHRMDIK